jgi:hypothetical protein
MLIPKPIITFLTQKSDHEILNERLSEHEKTGIQMKEIRPTNGSKKSEQRYQSLNDSDDNISPTKMEFDMQEHMSLKASHTLRASLEGREPEDFLQLVKEGLGQSSGGHAAHSLSELFIH